MNDITIYMFPGLGADETIFRNLKLPGYNVKHIRWIKPLNDETPAEYAKRLKYQIDPKTTPVLLGLSFGGMMAQEVARLIDPALTIIISSIKTKYERPLQMVVAQKLRPQKFIPSLLAIKFDFWHPWAFGKTTNIEKAFIKKMAKGIHPDFTDWAADAAINWDNTTLVPNLVHIHGDKDNLFPHWYIRNFILVKGGTHFMVFNRGEEVSQIVLEKLKVIQQSQFVRKAS
ncbi:hypothetical protein BH09BAC1_BH09BAC1_29870 [soil metagenome]